MEESKCTWLERIERVRSSILERSLPKIKEDLMSAHFNESKIKRCGSIFDLRNRRGRDAPC